jgi:PAS domain S-box-containing protein
MVASPMIRLDADNSFRILIVVSDIDYSHLLNSDRKNRYQIQGCESASEALAAYQQEPSGCILLDWETTQIGKELLSQINIFLVPVVILFETQNADIVSQNTEDCLAKESLTPELISFAIGQAIAKATLKQKLAEAEYKLHKYELTSLEKPQPSKDFLLSIHNLLSRQLQKELRDRQANENLLRIQNAILEKIAKGDDLPEILDMLVLKIETQLSNALCTILICDQHGKLNHVSSPNLPKTFANQCNGIPIDEGVGSCGTAAFRKKPVIVPDIATDYLWNNYKEIPLGNGLLACWSFPIINSEGLVLGTFGVYHREIYTPTTQELEIVSLAANIAGIALERDRATQELNLLNQELYLLNQELEMWVEQRTIALQASESKSRAILSLIPDLMFEVSVDGLHIEYVNEKRELSVVPPDIELVGKSMIELLPEDLFKRQSHYLREAIETGELQVYEHQVQVNGHLQDEEVRVIKSSENHALFMVRNISDRKSAEEAVKKSELKLRKLTENIPVVLYQFLRKPDGSISFPFTSQGAYQLYGFSPEAIQAKASLIFDLVHPEDLLRLNESIELSAQTLENWRWEGRIYTSTEELKWISGISQPELMANGDILWHGMLQDISDRKAVETALSTSESHLRALMTALPDLIVRVNSLGVYQEFFASESFEIIGDLSKIVGTSVSEVLPAYVAKSQMENIQIALQTGSIQIYEQEIFFDHRKQTEEVRIVPYSNDEALMVVRDISDRKMAELKLARSQEQLNYHIENSPLATIRWDREFRVEYWSKQAEQIFGWKAEEILGKNIYDSYLIFEDDIPHVQQVAEQLMKGFPQTCQNRNYRKDGTVIHCEWFNSVLMDENGSLISMLSLTQDITKRKQIEAEIAQSQETLRQTAATLKQQMERQHFITHITQQIHQSLNIDKILTTSVNEIKRLLNGDRVVVFQFIDGVTKVVKEMVNPEYLSIINMDIADNYFTIESINYHLNLNHDLALYSSDIAVKSINYHLNFSRNIPLCDVDVIANECSEKFIKQASVKSQIVIPIIQYTDSGKPQEINHTDYQKNDQLWGLLIVHSCAQYRHWQNEEVDLLKQIANQLAIAIQQASLYGQVQTELYNRQQFERQLMNELNQKKVLLKEIHHRVKNNLQVMSSILYLQFRNAPSEIKILTEEYQNRILAMSLIHEQLYRSDDLAHIDFHDYISNLAANLFECYGISFELINIEIEVEDVSLSLDQSIPLGLIINELVSNALKYAFPKKHGQISISLINETDQIILTISDDGVGLPEDFDLENADGLGMQLILSLAEQLEGNLIYEGKNGLTIKISFPNLS